jgi:hypothetical protein
MHRFAAIPVVRRCAFVWLALTVAFALAAAPSVASAHQPPHAAKQRVLRVHGAWTDPVGACADLSFDPSTGRLTCTGTTVFTGTWVGTGTWTFTGRIDPTSANIISRTREVFRGRTRHGRHGTLTLVEHGIQEPTGKMRSRAHIVRASGGLAGSRGHVHFIGQSGPNGSAGGTYSGRWRHGE